MFSPIGCEHKPLETRRDVKPGNVIVRVTQSSFLYGIYVGDASVVFQLTSPNIDAEGSNIALVTLEDFMSDGELAWCDIGGTAGTLSHCAKRALSAVGENVSEGVFSRIADDFVYWCVTGEHMGPSADDGLPESIFGEHLIVPAKVAGGVMKVKHHGIGIENHWVIHFNYFTADDTGDRSHWKKSAGITSLDKFANGNEVIKYAYKDASDRHRLDSRNRAVTACFSGEYNDYNLWFKNCEHLATWCATGQKSSTQIENVNEGLGMIALSGLTAIAGSPHPAGFIKGARKLAKHIRWPWDNIK